MKYTVSPLIGFTLCGTSERMYFSRAEIAAIKGATGNANATLIIGHGEDTWAVVGSLDEIRTAIDNHADHWWGE